MSGHVPQHSEHSKTDPKLKVGIDAFLTLAIKKVSVEYADGAELDPTKSYIIAISHQTGLDVPVVVKALADKLPLVVSDQSIHHGPINLKDPTTLSVKMVGQDNFPPISYVTEDGVKKPVFNPADAEAMTAAMAAGKSVVVAAHNPSDAVVFQSVHQVKPGYMAAYLAQVTGAEILPVLVTLSEGQGLLRRKEARVQVGAPYTIERDPEMADMSILMAKRTDEGLSPDEREQLNALITKLRGAGRQVLDSVAALDKADF